MRSRWLVVASLCAIMGAGCAGSSPFDAPWDRAVDKAVPEEDAEVVVPPPELAQTEYEVTVDLSTGAVSKQYVFKDVRWMYYNYAYNQANGEYTFIGMWNDATPPIYLYTYNRAGVRVAAPELPFRHNIISMNYSRSTGVLYGISVQDSKYSLVTIDKHTGLPSVIGEIKGASGLGDFTIDEANQRLFVADGSSLWTIDLGSGSALYRVPTNRISHYVYDNAKGTLYGLRMVVAHTGTYSDWFVSAVDPSTGSYSDVRNILDLIGVQMDTPTFNEHDQVYMLVGVDRGNHPYIFSLDVTTGDSHKILISRGNHLSENNLVFPRYDNKRKKLYAMYWQAAVPPPPG